MIDEAGREGAVERPLTECRRTATNEGLSGHAPLAVQLPPEGALGGRLTHAWRGAPPFRP